MIDSVFKIDKRFYPQVLLEECKHIIEENKVASHITKDLEISSDESDKEDFDEKQIKIICECLFKRATFEGAVNIRKDDSYKK